MGNPFPVAVEARITVSPQEPFGLRHKESSLLRLAEVLQPRLVSGRQSILVFGCRATLPSRGIAGPSPTRLGVCLPTFLLKFSLTRLPLIAKL